MMLLAAGASGYRVIRGMKRCARSLGFDDADVLVGFNSISATFHYGADFRTVVADVPLPGVNASRIEALETMAHAELQSYHSVDDVNRALDEIERIPTPRWPLWMAMIAAGLACAGFAVINQFGYMAACLVFLAAAAGHYVRVKLHHTHLNFLGVVGCSAFTASLLYLLFAHLLPTSTDLSAGFIAAVLFLIPGFPLFSSFVDLARFDFTSGIPRLFFALEIIIVIMLTVLVVAMLSGTPQPVPATHEPSWEYFVSGGIASFIGVGCFALLFNSSRRMALIAATVGFMANVGRLVLLTQDIAPFLAAFVAALFIGLIGSQLGRLARIPRVTVTIPAAVIMIPGTTIYAAVHGFAQGNTPDALYAFTDVALTVLFIAAGLTIARMLTDQAWAFNQHINFGKPLDGEAVPINR